MKIANLRIRSVRMKNGGATVRIIRPKADVAERLISHARQIADERVAGYAIVAWGRDGKTSTVCHSTGLPVPTMMIPEVVKMAVADWISGLDYTE